jgi:DNA-binding NarL/FixJ family response regulator
MPVRVFIIDDQAMVASALAESLASAEIEVVGTMTDGARDSASVVDAAPDVVLVDPYSADDRDDLVFVTRLRSGLPEACLLAVTARADRHALRRAMRAGCDGVVLKSQPLTSLIAAVRKAGRGDCPTGAGEAEHHHAARPRRPEQVLSPRELEVLRRLGEGQSTAKIADELFLSINTVRNHVQRVMDKLGAHSRLEAVSLAVRRGIIAVR